MIAARIRDEAALWMARSRDPKFSDWDGLTAWLEADPAHNIAYENAFAGHDLAGTLDSFPVEVVAAPTASPGSYKRRWVAGGSLAAAAAAVLLAIIVPGRAPSNQIVAETRAGEHRLLHLRDGTEIALNGDSRLVLNSSNGRTARLERGEALFSVVHDDTRPFTVDAGGRRMMDLGTRFNVVRSPRGSEVAVVEGAVLYDPEGAAVRLGAGRVLRQTEGSELVEVSQTDPATIGGWRSGHLVYRDTPLWRVADDLSRATGVSIAVDPNLAHHYFTGAFSVSQVSRSTLTARLAAVLDVVVAQRPEGLYLRARAGR